ncbi:hypothetical protein ACFZAR_37730 [Streptomyces sp. NPDC008222]|uniref:hypothetical protein n=1 Tax=Streptomyces sp. NPDC008222 TaxID=3364820 RepID=UPI0036E64D77
MRVRRALLAGAAATVLALTVPMGSAHAATGFFLYTTQPGNIRYMLYNPLDDVCYNVSGQGRILNETNGSVELYAYSGCRGDAEETLPPDSGLENATFVSVRFVRSPAGTA